MFTEKIMKEVLKTESCYILFTDYQIHIKREKNCTLYFTYNCYIGEKDI